MKAKLQRITIQIEPRLERWLREEASRNNISLSRLVEMILMELMPEKDCYEDAMCRALARKPFLNLMGRFMSREEAHRRAR